MSTQMHADTVKLKREKVIAKKATMWIELLLDGGVFHVSSYSCNNDVMRM